MQRLKIFSQHQRELKKETKRKKYYMIPSLDPEEGWNILRNVCSKALKRQSSC